MVTDNGHENMLKSNRRMSETTDSNSTDNEGLSV